ncbi:MAG TPA: deoxynucleoside kinase [Candidatus Limosilactobacillus intestinavium]|nr:deoxynucleoside kinase [Candidatus Limosilactobacillus intestinavium]
MIYINAPIGMGKTSLADILSEHLGTKAFKEDVDKIPLLSSFYDDGEVSREQKAYALQIEFLSYRHRQLLQGLHLQETQGMRNTVYDSSLISDGIMAKNLHDRGEFPDILYNDYLKLSEDMQTNVAGHPFKGLPDLIIYLRGSFDLMLDHIQQRGRKMETTDPKLKEYYRSVWEVYEGWYKGFGQCPVMAIDMDKYDFVNNLDDRKMVLSQIDQKLKNLCLID